MDKRKREKPPEPCGACQTVTAERVLHKRLHDGIVIRERVCQDCYFKALKNAIVSDDMSWARLNHEVQNVRDTIRDRRARERQTAWRKDPATDKQLDYLCNLANERCLEVALPEQLTKGEASDLIDELHKRPIPRLCSSCRQQFEAPPEATNGDYCDTCAALTPAQRDKMAATASTTVH